MLKNSDSEQNNLLSSRTIRIRLVEEDDAEFILSLRLDQRYNQYLSGVENNLEKQREWIKTYKLDEEKGKQFYFIIEKLDGTPCGTVRIYDLVENSFSWGSWILNENKTRYAAIESALLIYQFGFEQLNYTSSHFEVLKQNRNVLSFHKKFGAKQVSEDKDYIYFNFPIESYYLQKKKFEKFIS